MPPPPRFDPDTLAALADLAGIADASARTLIDPCPGEGDLLRAVGARFPELRVEALRQDLRRLDDAAWPPGSADAVLTAPPYAMRLGRKDNLEELHWHLLQRVSAGLRLHGRAVLLVIKRPPLARLLPRFPELALRDERTVELTPDGPLPTAFTLEKIAPTPQDRLRGLLHRRWE